MDDLKLKEIGWNDTKRMIVIYGIAEGMRQLHSKGFVHRNLNPDTIFLDDYLFPKIGGFEYSQEIDADFSRSKTVTETVLSYMAPEFIDNFVNYNRIPLIEFYSFGMTLYEIMTKQRPYGENPSVVDVVNRTMKEERPEIPDSVPEFYQDLIKHCWAQKDYDRPSFEYIVEYIRDIENPEFVNKRVNIEEFINYIKYTQEPEKYSSYLEKVEIRTEQKTKQLSIDLEEIDLSVYEKIQNVGQGAFGKVSKVFETTTGNIYACKISKYELNSMSDESIENMERELTIMSKIKHPSIVKFVGYNKENFKKQQRPTIITEFIPNGSLDIILSLERKGLSGESWNDTKKLITIYGTAFGMSYLHSLNILHRDLKPGNIFMDEFLFPKIGDFGLSKIVPNDSITENVEQKSQLKGTPAYLSPEIISKLLYCKAGDVYAFGMIVYEIMTTEVLYEGLNPLQVQLQVSKGIRPKFKGPIPVSYRELIEICWQNDPSERPTFDDIISKLENDEGFIIDTIEEDEYFKYIDTLKEIQENNERKEKIEYQKIMNENFDKIHIDLNLAKEEENDDEELIDDFLDLTRYKKVKLIRKDTLFKEFEVREKEKDRTYMAKVSNIKIGKLKRDELVQLSREVNILSQLEHPSIVKFIGYSPTDFSNKRRSVLVT